MNDCLNCAFFASRRTRASIACGICGLHSHWYPIGCLLIYDEKEENYCDCS